MNDYECEIEDGSFAEACYDSNSIEELIDGLLCKKADESDCEAWDLKAGEYKWHLANALWNKIQDLREICSHVDPQHLNKYVGLLGLNPPGFTGS